MVHCPWNRDRTEKYVFLFCICVCVCVYGLYLYLYLSKAELWFTMAPHLMVVHGKYTFVMVSLSPPSLLLERCASWFKSNYLGAEWALLAEKSGFSISISATKVHLNSFASPVCRGPGISESLSETILPRHKIFSE